LKTYFLSLFWNIWNFFHIYLKILHIFNEKFFQNEKTAHFILRGFFFI